MTPRPGEGFERAGGFGHPAICVYSLYSLDMAEQKQRSNNNQSFRGRGGRRSRRPRGMGSDSKSFTAPVATTKQNRTPRPKMTTLANGDCRITHREYIQDVKAGTGAPTPYTVSQLPVNPGQKTTFQWLSRIAANYESYVFEKLVFAYETEASTSLGGTMVLSLDYDASDAAPLSKQQAMAYRSSVRTAPWKGVRHSSKTEDLRKNKTNFVRPGVQPANTDIKTYDIGNLFIISQGVSTSDATLGELYVEYTVLLMTPVFEPLPLPSIGGNITGDGLTASAANPFGTAPTVDPQAASIAIDNASQITFSEAGTYLVAFEITGTVITADALVGVGVGVAPTAITTLLLASGLSQISIWSVVVTQPGAAAYTATATTITAASAWIGTAPDSSI